MPTFSPSEASGGFEPIPTAVRFRGSQSRSQRLSTSLLQRTKKADVGVAIGEIMDLPPVF